MTRVIASRHAGTRGKIDESMSSLGTSSADEARTQSESRKREAELRAFQKTFGMFGDIERRTFTHSVGEMRQSGTSATGATDGSLQVVGHAAVFGHPSVEMRSQLGPFREYIDPHAFDQVLRSNPDVLLTWDHDTRYVLGRTTNDSLDLSIDGTGLRYWSRVAPTSYAQDLKILMEGGYLNQSSFLFRVAKDGEDWEVFEDEEGTEVVQRTITQVSDLFDVCVCAAGAYPTADSGIARTLAYEYAERSGYITVSKELRIKEATEEYRALGDVAWGPDEGVDDLTCDIEEQLGDYRFSVVDVAVSLDKVIICDWNDYSFWVVPFTMVDGDPVALGNHDEWVQVETAWVTTTEGYEANIRSAKIRREARMAENAPDTQESVEETPTAEVEATAETVEVEAAPEAAADSEEAPAAEAEAAAADARKASLIAEARARIARAKTV